MNVAVKSFILKKLLSEILEQIISKQIGRKCAFVVQDLDVTGDDDTVVVIATVSSVIQTKDIPLILNKLSKSKH